MQMIQLDLFPESDPRVALEAIEKRLEKKTWVTVSSVAIAFDRSVGTVYGWIDEGRVVAMNSKDKIGHGSYKIFRPSVIAFAKKSLGIFELKKEES